VLKLFVIGVLCLANAFAASSLSGLVQDTSKAPIDGARLKLMPVPEGNPLETTSKGGRYSFPEVPKGEYVLAVGKSGFGIAVGAVRLAEGEQHELGFVLELAGDGVVKAAPPNREPSAGPSGESLAKTEPGPGKHKVKQAYLLQKVSPIYPSSARQARISGTVLIEVLIGADGSVNDMLVTSAPSPDLAIAALVAVQKWRYSPVQIDGKRVPALTVVDVNFQLQTPPR
jgi:TonB family protein